MNQPITPPAPAPAAAPAPVDRNEQIAAAVKLLNPEDAAHWTKGGEPDLNTLTELLGFKVTRAEVVAAAPDVKRDTIAPALAPAGDRVLLDDPLSVDGGAATDTPDEPAAPTPAPKAAKPTGDAFTVKNTHNGLVNIRGIMIEKGKTRTLTAEELANSNIMARINHAISNGVLQKV